MPHSHQSRAREREPQVPDAGGGGLAASWIQEHLDAVYRYARRRLSDSDAEDVAQQCFEALFRAEAAGRSPEDPGAYLLGVARRRVADVFRRRHRHPEPLALPSGWEGFGEVDLPEQALATHELRELVEISLGLLPGRDAALLSMRYLEGTSTAELAERLDLTPKAVENRLRRARARFLGHFRMAGGAELDERPAAPKGGPA